MDFLLFVFCSFSFTFFNFVLRASSAIEMLSMDVIDNGGTELILKCPVTLQLLYRFSEKLVSNDLTV